jgi:TolB-like protein/DNA-binding winged helix-turn-helix (wHTH) protein/Tfp pilus assembly protein PilF
MFALGPARLDLEKQVITVGARTVVLQRKPYLVLLYLIENRHRMVHRKELLDRFWDGKEVYDQSLSKAVGSIRKALGEPAGSELIETRWGLGYRYIGSFEELPDQFQGAPAPDGSEKLTLADEDGFVGAPPAPPVETISELKPHRITGQRRSLMAVAAGLVAVLAIVAFLLDRRSVGHDAQAASSSVRSVAVLPFGAASDDLEGQYFGLELADTLASRLATIPQLSVRSSATVRSVVGLQPDPGLASKKLEVQAFVTGQVRHSANGVVISVQLIDSATGATRWSGVFDTQVGGIFATEGEIAQRLAGTLAAHAELAGLRSFSGPGTNDSLAYGAYMKARFFATNRNRVSLARAIEFLNRAIALDPGYGRAYAALAECYSLQGFYQYVPPAQAYPRAREAALKALSLDASLLEAHVALLSILTDYDWDWPAAEREFKATIAIDPNYAVAYQYYGYTLFAMGRGSEALVAMKHAAQIDPVSPSIQTTLAWGLYLLRLNQQAVEQCGKVLELYPDYVPAHQLLGLTYDQLGSHPQAMAELNRAQAIEASNAMTPLFIDYELARTGRRNDAVRNLETLETMEANSSSAFVPDYYLAAAWAAIGDKRKAESSLDRAFQAHSNWLIDLHYDPRFDSLRSDKRFKELVDRIHPVEKERLAARG